MADTTTPGGSAPRGDIPKAASTPPRRKAPPTRQERRAAQRRAADARLAAAGTTTATTPLWKSPMLLLTVAAVAIGLVVIVIASGVLTTRKTDTGLTLPIAVIDPTQVDAANPRALGRADAPVTVEVWSDFQCPYCAQFATTTEPAFIDRYVNTGRARLVYRDIVVIDPPTAGVKGESHQAAAAARCAGDQGKFWQYHDFLFVNQSGENKGHFTPSFLARIADAVGLDRAKFDACMADGAPTQTSEVVTESAQGKALGVVSTPTIVVNGVLQVPEGQTTPGGALNIGQLAKTVDAILAGNGPTAAPASGAPTAVPSTAP